MKLKPLRTVVAALFLSIACTIPSFGQAEPAATQGPAMQALQSAAQALTAGSEVQAWQLYTQNSAAFEKDWKSLDPLSLRDLGGRPVSSPKALQGRPALDSGRPGGARRL